MEYTLDHKIQQFIDGITGPPIYTLKPEQAREILNNVQLVDQIDPQNDNTEDINVECNNEILSMRIIRPTNKPDNLPIGVYYHGGGWVLGNKYTHDRLIRKLSNDAQIAIIFVNYSPSPEADYTKILKQCFLSLSYISKYGGNHNLDINRIGVIGDSAGGNLAIVMTMLAKERGINLRCQALFYPVTDSSMNSASYEKYKDGPWLTKKAMEWFWDCYVPNKSIRGHKLLSPINALVGELKDLPPALIITGENDVLRDEGEAYGRNLIMAGVDTTNVRFLNTIHDFMMLKPLVGLMSTETAIGVASTFLKLWLVDKIEK